MGGEAALHDVKVRTVTSFIVLDKDESTWDSIIFSAVSLDLEVAQRIQKLGYEVQTLRIVTNPFGEYLDTTSVEASLKGMKKIQEILSSSKMPKIRIRFAIGEAKTIQEIRLIPALVREHGDIANACVNVGVDSLNVPDAVLIDESADVVEEIAKTTPRGEGNFNFTVNFKCPPLIPYFPASYNTREEGPCFALGFEHPDLLVEILQDLVPQGGTSIVTDAAHRSEQWAKAFQLMHDAMEFHTKTVVGVAHQVSKEKGVRFAGVDSSAAPSKNAASLTQVFRLLGVEDFGAAGSSEVAAYLTKLFKSITSAPLIGFSGLMLACLEDAGLAECAIKGTYDIRALLSYSAVCGIGLDTVPIPGDTPKDKICGLMKDVGAMAFRLNKPLTCRLFPVPGLQAGDVTKFESGDLCNCSVFAVP